MRVFSLLDFELKGANLIEASAGTGKTYTISALFLRLILEKALPVSKVLVVTFTRAATAELKQRLRNALVAAQRYCQTKTCEDPTLLALFEKALESCSMEGDEASAWVRFTARVNAALRGFDEAAIYTIHGFCQRAIKNNALLANSAFEMQLSANSDEIYESVIFDYWRQHLLNQPTVAKALQQCGMLPDADQSESRYRKSNVWKSALKQAIRAQGAQVEWEDFPTPLNANDIVRIQEIFQTQAMTEFVNELESALQIGKFNRNKIRNDDFFQKSRQAWLSVDVNKSIDVSARYLTSTGFETEVLSKLRKNQTIAISCPPECDELDALFVRAKNPSLVLAMRALKEFYECAPQLYREKQKSSDVTSFDDMLLSLNDALYAKGGLELAQALRTQYQAALIDEFQDTDAIQYGIFRRIFMEEADDNFVCFVGDPKQSIYRFRGADIQTYLTARHDIGNCRRFTLDKNYRSTGALIETVNALFTSDSSFGHDGKIAYEAVHCGNLNKRGLVRNGQEMKALSIVSVPKNSKPESVFELVTRQVVDYLSDENLFIDGKRVEAKDIAILLRSQDQIQGMQRALRACGVQSRVISKERIYDSDDAREVEAILRAVLNPRDLKSLKTALATRLVGCDALSVYRIGVDEVSSIDERQTLTYWLDVFTKYREDWEAHGAGFLMSRLIKEHETVKRYLSEVDGARRLTNLYHLIELLYAMSVEYRLPEALMENFGKLTQKVMDLDEDSPDALRMESDDNIVTIMTYHKSKGLEFPIVFLPCTYLLSTKQRAEKFNTFEEYESATGEKRISVAQTLRGVNKSLYHPDDVPLQEQHLAEQMRLFYVAVTRASRRLEIVDASVDASVTKYLIENDWSGLVERGLAEMETVEMFEDQKTASMEKVTTDNENLLSLSMQGRGHSWSMTSYSQMINRVDRLNDHHDEVVTPVKNSDVVQVLLDEGVDEGDIVFFPRGAEAGEALHQIMETIDFTSASTHQGMIDQAIERYFPNDERIDLYRRQAKQMLDSVLDVDLGDGWRLKDIGMASRVSEMEFLLAMDSAEIVSRLIERIRRENRPGYHFALVDGEHDAERIQGFLKGFIDLVVEVKGRYYILDWKSNFLSFGMPQCGGQVLNEFLMANYSKPAMQQAIQSHGYALQYLLYTVALHRLLKTRLGARYRYDEHFGGVFYLFMRGVRPNLNVDGMPCGVWSDRPSRELIEDLDAILKGEDRE